MQSKHSYSPLVILGLIAALVLLSGLFVAEKAEHFDRSGAVVTADASVFGGQQFNWRLVTSWPKNFPGLGTGPEKFADMVEQMSGGRLRIEVYGGGELVPALGVFDAVSSGAVEMGHSGAYYIKGKIPSAPFFSSIPFGMNVQELNAWIYYGGGLELWREAYAPFNVLPLPGGNTGVQMAGWFNTEINEIEDLRGLKMRIPGLAGEVFSRAGGTAINIAGGDIYSSMQTGVIDATEWVGPYNDRAVGLQEVALYYYYPGWHEPGSMLEFTINQDAWNRLPADLQSIVEVAARAVNSDMLDEYTAGNSAALAELIDAGVEPRPLPEPVLEWLRTAAQEYYAEQAASDPLFARIYASFKAFQQQADQWHQISEQAMYDLRRDTADSLPQ
jgi:TRAP-type mannitol/chloroaromatic compound transport system substrate-binding protein